GLFRQFLGCRLGPAALHVLRIGRGLMAFHRLGELVGSWFLHDEPPLAFDVQGSIPGGLERIDTQAACPAGGGGPMVASDWLSRARAAVFGPERPTYDRARDVLVRGLGVSYVAAFGSL